MKFETKAIHIGEEPNLKDGGKGDVVVPIHIASTFAREKVDKLPCGFEYTRLGNPTRSALEKRLAVLEDAKYGLAFTAGLSSVTGVILSLVKPNDHIIAFDDLYGGTKYLFEIIFKNYNIEFSYVDARNIELVKKAFKNNTKMVWLESPTNPLLKLCDIKAISKLAKEHNCITVVDNTFMSPYFQNPLSLGADIVVHSTTKYLNGHCDSIGGAVMLDNDDMYNKIKFTQCTTGMGLSPFDCFLVLRGIKTLAVRMKEHNQNAMKIAEYLENHPKVKCVYYPGLKNHPQYELAKNQMRGFGGMISFEIKGGLIESQKLMENLHLFTLAVSLGGVESLIEHPALMTHSAIPKEEREKIGISDSLLRISVGIENIDDLLNDLENGFKKI